MFCVVSTLKLILESVARNYICIGNADDRFVSLPTIRHGVLKDHSSKLFVHIKYSFAHITYMCKFHAFTLQEHYSLIGANIVAMIDSKRTGRPSVYHVACEILVPSTRESRRCSCCSSYRNVLRAIVFRSSKDDRTHPSSHTNYTALNSPEKNKRLHRLHVEAKNARQKLERLREKIGLDAARASPNVDEALDGDLRLTISEEDKGCERKYPEGSFQRVFWDQQKKAASLNNSRSMKWHPLFVKWCLYLRHVSGKGHEMLRKTGCICLPSQRTLRDYTHYTSTTIGFSAEVDKQLRDAVDMSEERNRYMSLTLYYVYT